MKKKYILRIPNNVIVLYFPKKDRIILTSLFKIESLKVKIKFFFKKNILLITKKNSLGVQNNTKRKLKSDQNTAIALVKQTFAAISFVIHTKLVLIGVGYRVLNIKDFSIDNKLFLFKLGYSHLLYFFIPKRVNLFCLKLTTLFIYSNSYVYLTNLNSKLKSYKKPEPYKGKGILYSDERITLKEGKKI